MQSVADSINENQKQIIEYGENITSYYASALTSLTSLSDSSLSRASTLIERNIKTLSEGGLTGLQFSFAPSVSQDAIEEQRDENQQLQEEMRSYYIAVENMQKTSLDLQYQEQMADNERKKAELLETLNEQKQALNSYFIEVETTQKTSNANVENQLSTHTSNITTQVSGLVQNVKTMVSELNSWLIDNPIKPSVSSSVFAGEVGKVQGTVGDGSAEDIVEIAKQYVGKSEFKHGSTGETISAKDACQAFVATVYEAAGVNASYTSKGTAAEARKAWGTHPIVEDGSGYIDYSDIPIGAVIYSQAGSDKRGHVSIYIGNGQIIEAGGSTVQVRNLNDTLSNRVYYSWGFNGNNIPKYAKGTKDYGIAGENYRREYAINKKTGEWHLIDEPTLFDKKEYDIVGEKVSAKIDKKIPKYATGTPISDPEVRKMVKAASDETGVPVNILLAVIDQESSNTWIDRKADSNGYSYGYMQLYDKGSLSALSEERRQAAMTDPAANIEEGAKYLKQMYESTNDWTAALSAYNQGLSGYKRNGVNSYGTDVFTKANSQAFVQAANEISGISSDVSSIAGSTASVAQSTSAMASVNFQQELKNLIDSDVQVDSDNEVTYQGDMLEYIKQNANIQEEDSNNLLSSWESLNSWYQDAQDMFNWYQERLIENRDTEDFAKISKYATSAANDYARDSINAQANITLQGLEDKYNNGKNLRDTAVQYYYDKKAEGATADELVTIIDAINTMDENLNSISDEYVSVAESLKEYLVGRAEREMQSYADQISWQDKNNQLLQRQLENTESLDTKMALGDAIISGEINKKNIYEQQKEAANNGVLDLRKDPTYAPIFDQFDIETWFDAEGNASAQFASDVERISITDPEQVTLMNRLFEIVQKYKQAWYEADEAAQNTTESIREQVQTDFAYIQDELENRLSESDFVLDMYGDEDFEGKYKETNNQLGIQLDYYKAVREQQARINNLYQQGLLTYDEYIADSRDLESSSMNILTTIKSLIENMRQIQIDKIQDQIDDVQEASEEVTDELEEQIDKLNEQKELLEDELDDWGNALEAVKKVVNEQIDALNESKESSSEYWNDQIDAAKNLNDETERTVSLLRAKGEVEKRQSQKSSLIYQNGRFVYMANQSNVDDARRDYEDTYREVSQERAIELLEESRDLELKSYEDRIKALEDYLDKLNEVTEKYTDEVNDLAAQELLGSDYQEEATNRSLSLLDKLENGYYKTESQIEGYINKRIDKLQKQIDAENKATDATVKNLEKQIDAIEDSDDAFNEFYETIVTMFKNGDEESIPGVIEAFVEKLPTILDGIDCSIITQKFEDAINNVDANIEIKVDGTGGGNTSSGDLPETPSSGDNNSGSNSGNQSNNSTTNTSKLSQAKTDAYNALKAWYNEKPESRGYNATNGYFGSPQEAWAALSGNLNDKTVKFGYLEKVGDTYYAKYLQYGDPNHAQTIAKFNGYAKGTDHAEAGLKLVGENGAELMATNGGESIITNDNVKALANNMEDFIELTPENNPWYDFVVGNKKLDFSTIDSRDMQKNMLKGFVGNVPEVKNYNENSNFSIGAINMYEVDNANDLLDGINRILPGMYLQRRNAKR